MRGAAGVCHKNAACGAASHTTRNPSCKARLLQKRLPDFAYAVSQGLFQRLQILLQLRLRQMQTGAVARGYVGRAVTQCLRETQQKQRDVIYLAHKRNRLHKQVRG